MKILKYAGALLLAASVGFALGSGGTAAETVEVPVTRTVEVEVEKTPPSCIKALDHASDAVQMMADVFDALGAFDLDEADRLANAFSAWAENNGDDLAKAAADCRSKGDEAV